jgi:hypothetical protein
MVAATITLIVRSFSTDVTQTFRAEDIAVEHRAWLAQIAEAVPVKRDLETESSNRGLATLETQATTI